MTARSFLSQKNTLSEWLQWQETLHPSTIDLGLARIHQVALSLFGDNFLAQQPLTITVGGTNGKGSCVTTLSVLLQTVGKRVGSFTSPHLLRYNERIRIDGVEVSDETLCAAFAAIDAARGDISLTYFEFNALAALWVFRQHHVDVQVLEVGLGGRLDAANLVDADIAVITNIALDHTDWLGDTREKIGAEKSGILRKNGKLIYGEVDMPSSIQCCVDDLSVEVKRLSQQFSFHVRGETFYWQGASNNQSPLVLETTVPTLPLASVACALQVMAWLGLWDASAFSRVLPAITLSGRMEKKTWQSRAWILDVAHNTAGALYVAQSLREDSVNNATVIFSAMVDKDLINILKALSPVVGQLIVFPLADNPRAASLAQLQVAAQHAGFIDEKIKLCDSVGSAVQAALDTSSAAPIVVCGSFFTVAAIQEYFQHA